MSSKLTKASHGVEQGAEVGGSPQSNRSSRHQVSATSPATSHATELIRSILANYKGPVAARVADGPVVSGQVEPACTMVFNSPGALRDLILYRDLLRLGGDFLTGAVDVEGDMESLFSITPYLTNLDLSWQAKLTSLAKAWRLPADKISTTADVHRYQYRQQQNSQASIAHHYDVSNDFYKLWLDPEMVYSCAYFRDADQSLAAAQADKLDYLCRKLRLMKGQSLLDIGCGWGALILWAARHYGVRAHGITLSDAQYRFAQERVKAMGLENQVKVELRDYRDLPDLPNYDRIVSVGMFEHVGIDNLGAYFKTVKRVLKPGGLFLNHGITNENGWRRTVTSQFVNRYVFPDGELTRVSDVTGVMEQSQFEILDVESLRRHYTLTLRHWLASLEAQHDAAVAASSEATYRLWRLYMAGAAYFFNEGSLNIYQILAGHAHQPLTIPLRRADLYRMQTVVQGDQSSSS